MSIPSSESKSQNPSDSSQMGVQIFRRAPLASGCRLLGLVFAERLYELPWKFLRVHVWDAYKGMASMEFSTAVLREVGRHMAGFRY